MSEPEFRPWPKTPRLFKPVVVTEKIDGTNACLIVNDEGEVFAQSRKRLITKEQDNHGFARWAYDNASALAETLGIGHHFGEWWGHGINRGYGCEPGERYFSLFNVAKWGHLRNASPLDSLSVVPVLWYGEMDTSSVLAVAKELKAAGSYAKPGYGRPEGICLFHTASNSIFKVPFDKDPEPEPARPVAPVVVPAPDSVDQLVKTMFFLAA